MERDELIMTLTKADRQKKIVTLINATGFMRSNELARKVGVTPMTIRRDVKELAKQNKLIKDYGGARSISSNNKIEFSTQEKMNRNVSLKKNIGKKLAKILPENCTIFLGAGTTLLYAVPFLIKKHITFVTNSVPSFSTLTNSSCRVISTGGELHKNTGEFLGEIAERAFNGLNLDYALCSTNGIFDDNVTTSNEEEGRVQNIAINHSRKSLIIADHTKLEKSDMITFRELRQFTALVTDDQIDPSKQTKYSKYTKVL